jgi:glycosyltransferase involved in cell wall biosynthesis
MKNTQSQISVIIPVYNGEKYLAEAITSVLNQTYKPLEIIIINDGSTDKTEALAKTFSPYIRYFSQENKGQAEAINKAVKLAKGDFFAFLDHDDLWLEDKLANQIYAFNADPDLELVFGLVQQFYSPELDDSFKAKIKCNSNLMLGHIPSSTMVKRESFFRVGLLESNLKLVSFPQWYTKAFDLGLKTVTIPELFTRRRLHYDNMGFKNCSYKKEYLHILKASLDRKRKKNNVKSI